MEAVANAVRQITERIHAAAQRGAATVHYRPQAASALTAAVAFGVAPSTLLQPSSQQAIAALFPTLGSLSAVAVPASASPRVVHVPSAMVGAIIGKRGSTVAHIRQVSGAQVRIADSEAGADTRPITISGYVFGCDVRAITREHS